MKEKANSWQKRRQKWIIRASIPLPIACKAIALPFELITLVAFSLIPLWTPSVLLSLPSNAVLPLSVGWKGELWRHAADAFVDRLQ